MAKITYMDDEYKYAKAFIKRDYSELAELLKSRRDEMSCSYESDGVLYGYDITVNRPLTQIYGADFYVVHFCFHNIDTMHDLAQEACICRLLDHLMAEIDARKGYYNLKIPTHIVDLIRAFNQLKHSFLFCGGTVQQYIYNREVAQNNKNGLRIFVADSPYIEEHREEFLTMTQHSFETYQGQYHISHVISDKAGEIYRRWIAESLMPQSKEMAVVAEYQGALVGYVTVEQDDFAMSGILSSVSDEYRQLGAYRAMIAYIINDAYQQGKGFVTCTQFDNFIVQGVWNSLGLKPFCSFYNMHYDNR